MTMYSDVRIPLVSNCAIYNRFIIIIIKVPNNFTDVCNGSSFLIVRHNINLETLCWNASQSDIS